MHSEVIAIRQDRELTEAQHKLAVNRGQREHTAEHLHKALMTGRQGQREARVRGEIQIEEMRLRGLGLHRPGHTGQAAGDHLHRRHRARH